MRLAHPLDLNSYFMSSAGHWPIILVEGVLVAGGALAFAWWQLRDLKKEQARKQFTRQDAAPSTTHTPDTQPSSPSP
jgi:hypothetical protein